MDLKLLAPTALVSLILVGACLFGAWYLNDLHFKVSDVLSENVQSTTVAANLEITARELLRLLRGKHQNPKHFIGRVEEQNAVARGLLEEAEKLANLEHEGVLVRQIADGLKDYLQQWSARDDVALAERDTYDATLADHLERQVLAPCDELRRFNLGEVEKSDRENRAVVTQLQFGLLALGLVGPLSGLALGYAVASRLHHSISQLSVRIKDAAGRLNRELGSVIVEENQGLPELQQHMQHLIEEIGRVVDQLQQREHEVLRAEQLAAVGQVAAGVAHELRNPLAAIKMLVQTGLEGEPASGLPPDDLAVIEHEIRRMEQYLKTFLDFARPPRSERRRTDLLAVIRRALALVEGRAAQKKVTVLLEPAAAGPVTLEIDPEQVNQVLVNLLLNALDVLPRGGTVRVEVEERPATATVEVRVHDNGPGIAPRVRERLFEPFVSGKEDGLGLGLSICKRLIEAHGGTIRAADGRGGGTVFAFTLPCERVTQTV
jgi:signal transduction histidine kinase